MLTVALIDWMYFHTEIDMDALAEQAERALRENGIEVAHPDQWAALTLLAKRVRHLQDSEMPF